MKRSLEEKLLDPPPGSRIEAAREFGIDMTLLIENLRLTPAQRVRANDQAVNDLIRFEHVMSRARRKAPKRSK